MEKITELVTAVSDTRRKNSRSLAILSLLLLTLAAVLLFGSLEVRAPPLQELPEQARFLQPAGEVISGESSVWRKIGFGTASVTPSVVRSGREVAVDYSNETAVGQDLTIGVWFEGNNGWVKTFKLLRQANITEIYEECELKEVARTKCGTTKTVLENDTEVINEDCSVQVPFVRNETVCAQAAKPRTKLLWQDASPAVEVFNGLNYYTASFTNGETVKLVPKTNIKGRVKYGVVVKQQDQSWDSAIRVEVDPAVDSSNFKYYKNLTLNLSRINHNLTGFRMLVNITDSDLRNDALTNGGDIYFTNTSSWDGSEKLPHEIEFYNSSYNSTHARLIAWVSMPNLSIGTIQMVYGNSSNLDRATEENATELWREFTNATYLFAEQGSMNSDSTTKYDLICRIAGYCPLFRKGIIGGAAADFNEGSSGYWSNITGSLYKDAFWIMAWAYIDTIGGSHKLIVGASDGTDNDYFQLFYRNEPSSGTSMETRDASNLNQVLGNNYNTAGVWMHHAVNVNVNGGIANYYINGANIGSSTTYVNDLSSMTNTTLGYLAFSGGSEYMDGAIDNVWIGSGSLSEAFINLSYLNQKEPAAFFSVGTETVIGTQSSANEAEGDIAIELGINSSLPIATKYKEQQVYVRNLSNNQTLGRFDWVAVFGNQRWLLNYITTGESYVRAPNLTTAVYVLEITNKTSGQITSDVLNFINATKAS
ncbi:hypothetical protein HYU17_02500 [Candidatus Woesearchaeota archaeon]|nr:hypothetical protein [Candidatus Woesearchaeota archaeon]